MLLEENKDLMGSTASHYSKDSDLQVLMYSEIVPLLERYSAADVCFLCDVTGGTDIYIESIKDTIKDFALNISEIIKTSPRLAFIGFRDINDKHSLLIKDFTSNPEELIKAMNKVKCMGGHDVCEDIIEPLKQVLKLTWKSDLMYVYILLDAPTHGKRYYEEKYHEYSDFDKYPNADKGELLEKLMCHYRRSKINLVLLQTNPSTNKMIQIMRENYESYKNKLTVIQIEERAAIRKEFEKNFIPSISDSFAKGKWNNFRKIKRKDGAAIYAPPELDGDIEFYVQFQGEVYSAFIEGVDFEKKEFKYKLEIKKVHTDRCAVSGTEIGVGKFSKHRRLVIGENKMYVIKVPKIPITDIETLINDIELSAFVEFFVQKFNSVLNERKKLIEKLDVVIIKNIDKNEPKINGSTVYLAQKFAEGDYVKYNNNYGWVNPAPSSACMIAQAFSHFTFEYSLGTMLVVDVKGVFDEDRLVITGPAIHSMLFRDRFGATNHAKVGILRFFQTHKCNYYCKKLKLLNPKLIESLSSSKLEAIKKEKALAHLYEELDKKIKESQTQIKQFDPTIQIKLEPIDEGDGGGDNLSFVSDHKDHEDALESYKHTD